jgi:hypothetical protein
MVRKYQALGSSDIVNCPSLLIYHGKANCHHRNMDLSDGDIQTLLTLENKRAYACSTYSRLLSFSSFLFT